MPRAYYNEHDPHAAAWLENLIAADAIPPGDVDTRDIQDVPPMDLAGYDQHHFFAGVGVFPYALRQSGWPDGRAVWTGSCPCQPLSAAGQRRGFDDERHLWPAFYWLISQCRPPVVFGEQVASLDALRWADLVASDMEAADYAFGEVDTCAAGFGAFHIRQRLVFSAYDLRSPASGVVHTDSRRQSKPGEMGRPGNSAPQANWKKHRVVDDGSCVPVARFLDALPHRSVAEASAVGGLADMPRDGRGEERQDTGRRGSGDSPEGRAAGSGAGGASVRADPLDGFWRDADWLLGRDDKWRPVEPGTFPLAHGAPARMGRLRGYGNAIYAAQAIGHITAFMSRESAGAGFAGDLFEAAMQREK